MAPTTSPSRPSCALPMPWRASWHSPSFPRANLRRQIPRRVDPGHRHLHPLRCLSRDDRQLHRPLAPRHSLTPLGLVPQPRIEFSMIASEPSAGTRILKERRYRTAVPLQGCKYRLVLPSDEELRVQPQRRYSLQWPESGNPPHVSKSRTAPPDFAIASPKVFRLLCFGEAYYKNRKWHLRSPRLP